MDPIQLAQERLQGLLPDTLGMEFIEIGPERVCAKLLVRRGLCTVGDILHGGAIMAFADTLGAMGTVANLPPGAGTTTIESKTNFLRAAPCESTVIGETTPLHRGRTTQVWQTRISSEDGKLLAVVTQTQMVLPSQPSKQA
ncbi:MAG: PaaI family thioesterase [Pirellulales bacterium]